MPPVERTPRLQPLTRGRVAALGEAGRAWRTALPGRLDELCEQWGLTLGRPLPGGSASYVVRATRGGEPCVLKVRVPDPSLADEAPVLLAANGVGYVRLLAHEPDALLLEQLGPSLDRGGLPPEDTLTALVDTLELAWRIDPDRLGAGGRPPAAGEDKASRLLADLDQHLAGVAPEIAEETAPVVATARGLARDLAASYDESRTVVVHGDAHPGNALRRASHEWAFVDPDGFRADPEYDLGVTLRDFSHRLLAAGSDREARALARSWLDVVAGRADAERVAAWAFLERVSTGLFVCSIGSERVGMPFLRSAARLLPGTS